MAVRIREIGEAELTQLAPHFGGLVQDAALTTLVAQDGNEVVGHVQVSWQGSQHSHLQPLLQPGMAEVRRLRVENQAQGTGVASALLRQVDELARRRSIERLGLAAGANDHELRAIYRAKGYVEIEVEPFWSNFGHNYDTHESVEKVVVYMTKEVGIERLRPEPAMTNSL